jgi:hypothetical protein
MAINGEVFHLLACHAVPSSWNHQRNKPKDKKYPPKLNYHIYNLASLLFTSENGLRTVAED